jgi:hypothetical protein
VAGQGGEDAAVGRLQTLQRQAVELFVDDEVAEAAGGRKRDVEVAVPGLDRVADRASEVVGALPLKGAAKLPGGI